MEYPTKFQIIKRNKSEQWYIDFPSAVAQAIEFEKGEKVESLIENKKKMTLKRFVEPAGQGKNDKTA